LTPHSKTHAQKSVDWRAPMVLLERLSLNISSSEQTVIVTDAFESSIGGGVQVVLDHLINHSLQTRAILIIALESTRLWDKFGGVNQTNVALVDAVTDPYGWDTDAKLPDSQRIHTCRMDDANSLLNAIRSAKDGRLNYLFFEPTKFLGRFVGYQAESTGCG
jgi:hypothetical protein